MPFVKQRMLVVNREQIELTPIENAIDTVDLQTSRIQAEIKKPVPDVKSLQPLLQGSCLVMVQKGMVEGICSSFLSKSLDKWPRECIARLIVSTERFVKAVEDGLRLHLTIVPSEMEQMHMELEKGFRRMRSEVQAMINGARDLCELDDSDMAKAEKDGLILNERITTAPQFLNDKHDMPTSSSSPSLVSTRRNARPLQRRMSVNISPLVIPQVGADGTVIFSDRNKRKRSDSFGCVSPTSPPIVRESNLGVVTVPAVAKQSGNEPVDDTKKKADAISQVAPGAKEVSSESDTSAMDDSSSDLESEYSSDAASSDDDSISQDEKKEADAAKKGVKASSASPDANGPRTPTSPGATRSSKARSASGGHHHGHHHRHSSSSRKTEEKPKHRREKSTEDDHVHSHEHTPKKSKPSASGDQKQKLSRHKSRRSSSANVSGTPSSPVK